MTHREFLKWAAWYAMEPFGEQRDDLRIGVLAATVCNLLSSGKGKLAKPSDFMLKFEDEKPQKPEDMMNALRMVHEALGGK